MARESTIGLRGPYDLREVALMGFGHRAEQRFDGVMRFAFCVDGGLDAAVGVGIRQDGQRLHVRVHDRPGTDVPDLDVLTRQVARIVSADHDGDAYARVCRADPVLSRVHAASPGFRPSLFCSPYEAVVWAHLSARRSRAQGIALRQRLADRLGSTFDVEGVATACVPGPTALLTLDALPGLPDTQVPRLHAAARAALSGELDVERLAVDPDAALEELQRLPGVGPFYAALVVLRACGLTDAMSSVEPRSRAVVQTAYGLPTDPTDEQLRSIAAAWRPFRTWALVALRAVGTRPGVLEPAAAQ